MRNEQPTQNIETSAIKAIAAASKTPFKTAFLATLGVGAAQLALTFAFFGGLAVLGTVVYLIAR